MSKMVLDFVAKQQQLNVGSQSKIPLPTCQGLCPNKDPAVDIDPTFHLDDVILTDSSVSLVAKVPPLTPNDKDAKFLARLEQKIHDVEEN
ncbi:uncharacterized protein J3R85_021053 [Psidium guajava]|nr:uncharacterized protein J3R85_021053 [Psidium guajava]